MRSVSRSAAGDEGDDDVGGVAIEVLAASVVDGRGAGVGVTSGDLDVCPSRAPPAPELPAGPFGERLGPEPAGHPDLWWVRGRLLS